MLLKTRCLSYSQAKKLEASGAIKEERYKDICRLVVEAFWKHDGILEIEIEALIVNAFNAVVREFRSHSLHLFESLLQTDLRTRFACENLCIPYMSQSILCSPLILD